MTCAVKNKFHHQIILRNSKFYRLTDSFSSPSILSWSLSTCSFTLVFVLTIIIMMVVRMGKDGSHRYFKI